MREGGREEMEEVGMRETAYVHIDPSLRAESGTLGVCHVAVVLAYRRR